MVLQILAIHISVMTLLWQLTSKSILIRHKKTHLWNKSCFDTRCTRRSNFSVFFLKPKFFYSKVNQDERILERFFLLLWFWAIEIRCEKKQKEIISYFKPILIQKFPLIPIGVIPLIVSQIPKLLTQVNLESLNYHESLSLNHLLNTTQHKSITNNQILKKCCLELNILISQIKDNLNDKYMADAVFILWLQFCRVLSC